MLLTSPPSKSKNTNITQGEGQRTRSARPLSFRIVGCEAMREEVRGKSEEGRGWSGEVRGKREERRGLRSKV